MLFGINWTQIFCDLRDGFVSSGGGNILMLRIPLDRAIDAEVEAKFNGFMYCFGYKDEVFNFSNTKPREWLRDNDLMFAKEIMDHCQWIPQEHYLSFYWRKKGNGSEICLEYCLGDDISSGDDSSD